MDRHRLRLRGIVRRGITIGRWHAVAHGLRSVCIALVSRELMEVRQPIETHSHSWYTEARQKLEEEEEAQRRASTCLAVVYLH